MNILIPTKNRVLSPLVGPFKTEKQQFFYKWLKIWTFQPKFDKNYSFYQQSLTFYDVLQK